MGIGSWYQKKPAWQKGGIVGIVVCILLAVFYITVYNALLVRFFPDGMLPLSSLILPLVTGHFFVFASHFISEGYVAPFVGCIGDSCFKALDWITLVGMGILLLAIYFVLGAAVGEYIKKRKGLLRSN